MDFHKLEAFIAVVEEGSISRAVVRLNIRKPSLTRIIKALEEELNTPLFKCFPSGLETTEAGKVLYHEALSLLNHVQAIPQRIKSITQDLDKINFGFTNSVGLHPFLPNLLHGFREAFPKVSIHLVEESSNLLIDSINNGKNDIIFLRIPVPISLELNSLHILDEPLVVAMPNNHPLTAQADPLQLLDLKPYDFVRYRHLEEQNLFDNIMASFYQLGFRPRIIQEAPLLSSCLNLIAAGIGLSIVPEATQYSWSNKQIVYKSLNDDLLSSVPIYAVYKCSTENIHLQYVLKLLSKYLK